MTREFKSRAEQRRFEFNRPKEDRMTRYYQITIAEDNGTIRSILFLPPDLLDVFEESVDDLTFQSVEALQSDADPTPWCHACGAMNSVDCVCDPIAENE